MEQYDMQVIIMRGLPGCGKSTLAKNTNGAYICSADDYHIFDGVYQFDVRNAGMAHGECLKKFISALQDERPLVIVDNTNIRIAEIAPYYAAAEAYRYNAEIRTVDCDPYLSVDRNTHGVPAATIFSMFSNMIEEERRFPPRWEHFHERATAHPRAYIRR